MKRLLFAIVPPAASVVAYAAGNAIWPLFAGQFSGDGSYWLLRSLPVVNLMAGPLAGLATVAALPLHQRQAVAISTLLTLFVVAAAYGWREYERLLPFTLVQGQTWENVSRYVDVFVIAGSIIGFGLSAASARLALPGNSAFRRAKSAVFGDADWMALRAPPSCFPPTARLSSWSAIASIRPA